MDSKENNELIPVRKNVLYFIDPMPRALISGIRFDKERKKIKPLDCWGEKLKRKTQKPVGTEKYWTIPGFK